MKLKTFVGASMNDVMSQIKRELGDEAVIVSSRTQDDGSLRVTAALEEEPIVEAVETFVEGIDDPAALFGGIRDYGVLPEQEISQDDKLDLIAKALTRHGIPGQLHQKIMLKAEQQKNAAPLQILTAVLKELFSFDPLPITAYERPMMLVGQPGAGKTTTIAKLAARSVFNNLKTVVITADTTRAGGVEQLAAFTKVLNLPLLKVNNPEELKKALDDNKDADHIYIDCPGLNAFDAVAMKDMHAYIKVMPMDLIVTLPGGMDTEESMDIARAFAILGAKWILPTRLDMSRRLGGLLAAADRAGLGFAGMGHKPDIADGFAILDATILAKFILPQTEEKKK
jgi:flagellar biosynthesis protein FlhF